MGPFREDISFEEVAMYFNMPILEAANRLGVCNSTLKRVCRENGIPRWPYRKIMAGRTIQEIKDEAAQKLALIRSGGIDPDAAGDDDGADAFPDVTPSHKTAPSVDGAHATPASATRSQFRDPSLVLRFQAPAAKTWQPPSSGVKRPLAAISSPRAADPQETTPLGIKSRPLLSATNPPSFPFPFPVPLLKRQAMEARFSQPSFRQHLESIDMEPFLSSTSGDLWGKGGAGKVVSGGTAEHEDSERRGALKGVGFDRSVFEAASEIRRMRERQLDRFKAGMECAMSRGFAIPFDEQDVAVLKDIFGEDSLKQWL